MTKLFVCAFTALLFAVGPIIAADDTDEFENRAKKINSMADKNSNIDVALQRISTETGVPVENVRSQHKRYPETGTAGLLIANVLANETKKAPSEFLNQHAKGKKWLAIARDNKVSVDKLNERLDRLEKALSPAPAKN